MTQCTAHAQTGAVLGGNEKLNSKYPATRLIFGVPLTRSTSLQLHSLDHHWQTDISPKLLITKYNFVCSIWAKIGK